MAHGNDFERNVFLFSFIFYMFGDFMDAMPVSYCDALLNYGLGVGEAITQIPFSTNKLNIGLVNTSICFQHVCVLILIISIVVFKILTLWYDKVCPGESDKFPTSSRIHNFMRSECMKFIPDVGYSIMEYLFWYCITHLEIWIFYGWKSAEWNRNVE